MPGPESRRVPTAHKAWEPRLGQSSILFTSISKDGTPSVIPVNIMRILNYVRTKITDLSYMPLTSHSNHQLTAQNFNPVLSLAFTFTYVEYTRGKTFPTPSNNRFQKHSSSLASIRRSVLPKERKEGRKEQAAPLVRKAACIHSIKMQENDDLTQQVYACISGPSALREQPWGSRRSVGMKACLLTYL